VTPSLLQALAVPAPSNVHGQSFWPLLQGLPYTPRTEVFAEKTFHTYYEPMRAIRTSRHKLIVNLEVSTSVDVPADVRESPIYPLMLAQLDPVREPIELYDLTTDPWEHHNLAAAQPKPARPQRNLPGEQPASSGGLPDLAGDPDVAAIKAELCQRLLVWMQETEDPVLHGPVASPYYFSALASLGSR